MTTTDVSAIQIAAGLFGSVSLGTTVFLLLQIIKGLVGDRLNGRIAEIVVVGTSLAAVLLAMLAIDTDWYARETWVSVVVGTLATTIIARGLYSQLFKASVEGVPIPPDMTVPAAAITPADEPYDAEERAPIAPAVMATVQREPNAPRGTRRTKGTV